MLDALRKSTGGWVAWIFIVPLVLSFAVWGIGDVFRGFGARTVATVGDIKIPAEEYRTAIQAQQRAFGQQFGRPLTPAESRALGVDRQVLERLINEAALENQGREMRLGISDKAIAERILREPIFKDVTGQFSQTIFQQILQANGLSEGAFVARQRDTYVRQQLVSTVAETPAVPQTLLRAADIYQNETRRLDYFILPMEKIDQVAEPTAEQLQKYYDGNKSAYTAPEYRKLGVLPVLPEDVAKTIAIPEADLKAQYEASKGSYRQEEKRSIRQIPFPDKAAAQAAYDKIKAGTATFDDIAKERNISTEDTNLGTLAKGDLADQSVGDAAFSLPQGQVSQPVEGLLNTVLLLVTEIKSESVTTFEQAKEQIRVKLAKERAVRKVLDLHDKIEDERAAGATLADLAKTLELKFLSIAAVDRKGLGPDGKAVELPAKQKLLGEAFQTEPGVESDPIDTPDQGLVWFTVQMIQPAKLKPFDEVRDQVVKDWREDQQRKQLRTMAQQLAERARKGEAFEDIAKGLGLEVKKSEPLKRASQVKELGRAAVAQAFALSQGGYGSADIEDRKARVVFRVAAIEKPESLDNDAAEALRKSLEPQYAQDFVVQYVNGLTDRYSISRNQALIDQLAGTER